MPARISSETAAAVAQAAISAHTNLRLRDWSRIDFIVDHAGVPWFLEANVAPGMTETSLVPQALSADNFDIGRLMVELVKTAVQRIQE